jgi:hypothetical protein
VVLFPTSFAPKGVVRVELEHASARCRVQGNAHTASTSYDYRAVVKHFNGVDYTTAATVVPGMVDDPLEAIDLSVSVGGGKTLDEYVASWSALTADKVVDERSSGVTQVKLPGIVKIASESLRADDGSVVSLTLGALGCRAEDAR